MAKAVKNAAKNAFILFRIIGFVLVLAMLAPIFKIYRMFVKQNGSKPHRAEWELGSTDPLFAPLTEIQLIRPARADIPPH